MGPSGVYEQPAQRWLVAFNRAIDGVMESNQKARSNPKALHTLDDTSAGGEQFGW